MPILEEINNLKTWVRDTMPVDVWIEVTDKQKEVFKHLMMEWYGWPVFSLNFNKDGNKVMKIMI
jgi:hypothetical protein